MTLSTKIPPESMSYFISITLNYTVFCTSPWPPILLVHPSFSFHLPSSFLLPNLLRCLQISPSTSVSPPFRLVEACLECTVSTDYFYSSSSPSSLPPSVFTSVHAGVPPLSRSVVSGGRKAPKRRGFSGNTCKAGS